MEQKVEIYLCDEFINDDHESDRLKKMIADGWHVKMITPIGEGADTKICVLFEREYKN